MTDSQPLLGEASHYNTKKAKLGVFSRHWKSILIVILAVYALFASQHSPPEDSIKVDPNSKKNIIFVVTDGMGPASLALTRGFKQYRDKLPIDDILELDKHLIGSSRTRSSSSLITDSAAGATAFSCALKSYNGAIGVDPSKNPCGTILEALKLQGYTTGLTFTTRGTDATPAAFSSHVDYRSQEDLIAEQQLGEYPLGRVVDLYMGGGRCHFLPSTVPGGCRADSRNLIKEYTEDKKTWSYVGDRQQFDELDEGNNVTLPLLALLATTDIPFDLDRNPKEYPSLAEQVKVSLKALSKATKDKDKGFFLLVESSRIDHTSHLNCPASHPREVLAYDEAFKEIKKFIDESDVETVVISTSDHETGGITVGRQVTAGYPDYLWYPEVLLNSTHSGEYLVKKILHHKLTATDLKLDEYLAKEIFHKDLGITDFKPEELEAVKNAVSNPSSLQDALNIMVSTRAQIGWSTHGHTAVDVNIYGYASAFGNIRNKLFHPTHGLAGNHENIEIGKFMAEITGADLSKVTGLLKDTKHHPDIADIAGLTQSDPYHSFI